MIDKELQQILSIQQSKRWQIFKRIKKYFQIKRIKKSIKIELEDKGQFIENLRYFCYFIDTSIKPLGINIPDNLLCKIVIYNNKDITTLLRFTGEYEVNTLCKLVLTVEGSRTDRIHTSLTLLNKPNSDYNIFIYEHSLSKYDAKTSIGSDRTKALIINATINFIYSTIIDIIDTIAIKYIEPRKEHSNEAKTEEIPESECQD